MELKEHSKLELTGDEERLIFAMQLLGDKTRYKMFKLVQENRELCVSEIAANLNISVSAASQHFRHFEQLGLVDKERIGQKICYLLRSEDKLVGKLVDITTSSKTK